MAPLELGLMLIMVFILDIIPFLIYMLSIVRLEVVMEVRSGAISKIPKENTLWYYTMSLTDLAA